MRKFKDEIYRVKKGDTINAIANEYKVNPTQILLANNITPKMLHEGMVLYIKSAEKK